MKKRQVKTETVITAFALAVVLSACAGGTDTDAAPDTSLQQAQESAQDSKEAVLVTEDDYRNAIADADDDRKLELYREFASNYRMKEEEYREYADLCDKAGDTVAQRDALFALYRMDPTEANGELLSGMTLKITASDDEKAEETLKKLVEVLKGCEADDFSSEGIKRIIESGQWKGSFHIDNGTFTSNTQYTGDELSADISSDQLATRAVITDGDKRYLCDISYNGTSVGYVGVKDGVSDGEYYYRQKDTEDVDIVAVSCYISGDHYVNQIDITVGGISYHGALDESGKTKEEQPEGFNGVVYAYTEDKGNYLYVENADPSTWVAKAKDMGFGEF